jgi:hypothetical protein
MKIGLDALRMLNKFSNRTTKSVSLEDVQEIVTILQVKANPETVFKCLTLVQAGDDAKLADWILEPDNQAKMLDTLKPAESKLIIACPECDELGAYPSSEVAKQNPHVICRFCQVVIYLEED